MTRFADWWAVYPKKSGKVPCEKKWKQLKLDSQADMLIADVKKRQRLDKKWLQGFIPNPHTYLHQQRWQDEIDYAKYKPTHVTPEFEPTVRDVPNVDRYVATANLLMLPVLVWFGGVSKTDALLKIRNDVADELRVVYTDDEYDIPKDYVIQLKRTIAGRVKRECERATPEHKADMRRGFMTGLHRT